jgi:hypothetical protein
LDWEVGRLRPFKYSASVDAELPILIGKADAIRYQPASFNKFALFINRWNGMICRQSNKLIPACGNRFAFGKAPRNAKMRAACNFDAISKLQPNDSVRAVERHSASGSRP